MHDARCMPREENVRHTRAERTMARETAEPDMIYLSFFLGSQSGFDVSNETSQIEADRNQGSFHSSQEPAEGRTNGQSVCEAMPQL